MPFKKKFIWNIILRTIIPKYLSQNPRPTNRLVLSYILATVTTRQTLALSMFFDVICIRPAMQRHLVSLELILLCTFICITHKAVCHDRGQTQKHMMVTLWLCIISIWHSLTYPKCCVHSQRECANNGLQPNPAQLKVSQINKCYTVHRSDLKRALG